jgi:ribonuclease HI
MDKKNKWEAWVDGACSGNPGPGGYSVVIECEGKLIGGKQSAILQGNSPDTTNNRMELQAFITALRFAKEHGIKDITIYTDSKYVSNPLTCGWLKKWHAKGYANKANTDQWRLVSDLLKEVNVEVIWVKGHADNANNILADKYAVEAMNMLFVE